jgi:hypothetical protein
MILGKIITTKVFTNWSFMTFLIFYKYTYKKFVINPKQKPSCVVIKLGKLDKKLIFYFQSKEGDI